MAAAADPQGSADEFHARAEAQEGTISPVAEADGVGDKAHGAAAEVVGLP